MKYCNEVSKNKTIIGNLLVAKNKNGKEGRLIVEGGISCPTSPVREYDVANKEYVDNAMAGSFHEEYLIIGDGRTNNFFISHTLGIKDVITVVYDSEGRQCQVAVKATSIGNLVVSFSQPPNLNDTFKIIIQK